MKLGVCHLWGQSLAGFREELRVSNQLGYEIVGIGDSPAGWHELYVSMTIAALETERAVITPWVTSPFLRHPLVAANALSSLYELSGGRVALGLATGGSNVISVGRAPATQKEINAYWDSLSALFAGQPTQYDGRPVAPLQYPAPVPIFYSAFGPKALALSGEKADGAIIFTGMDLDATAQKIQRIRDAAQRAGRDPESVKIWVTAFCSIRDSRAQAIDDLKAFIVVNGLAIRTPEALARVPAHLKDKLFELQRRYDPTEHVAVNGKNVQLLNELGPELTEYLAGMDTVVGSREEVGRILQGLKSLGVDAFVTNMPGHADRIGHMHALAELMKTII